MTNNILNEKSKQKNLEFIPNFTQYPNEILDNWMPHLSGNQTKIMNVFVRQIYGYHKDYDRISIRQISQKTGIHTAGVFRDLKILISIGAIRILKKGNKSTPHTYQIVNVTELLSERIHNKKDKGVIGEITGCYRSDNSGVIGEITEVLSQREQQNKELNKSKINVKERESQPIQETSLQSESLTHSQSFQNLGIGIQRPEQILQAIYRQLSSEGVKFERGSDVQSYVKYRDQIESDPGLLVEKINRMRKLAWLKENYVPLKRHITNEKAVKILDGIITLPNTFSWAFSNYSTEVEPLFELVQKIQESNRIKQEREQAKREEEFRLQKEREEELKNISWEEKEKSRIAREEAQKKWHGLQKSEPEKIHTPDNPVIRVRDDILNEIKRITSEASGRAFNRDEETKLQQLYKMAREAS